MSRMMRNALYVLLASVFLLAACGGGGDDDTPAPDGATPEAQDQQPPIEENFSGDLVENPVQESEATYYNELGTIIPQELVTPSVLQLPDNNGIGGFIAPPVGVLGAASTRDPNIPRVSGFDYLFYEQAGGINNEEFRIELYADGRIVLNSETNLTASAAEISAIASWMDQIDFFGMQGTFLGPPTSAESDYTYRMGASQSDGTSRIINARDGYMPPEIIRLFALVRSLIEDNPNLPIPTPTPTATP